MQLKDRTVVITGGSEGLGFALAKAFMSKGSHVHIIGRNPDKLHTATESLPGSTGHRADVGNFNELQSVSQEIEHVDILINNAGMYLEKSLLESPDSTISELIDTNLKGVIYATKAFLPKLVTAPEAHLINVSSTSGLKGRENQSVYVASKFGVSGFTESLKLELMDTNVKVSGFYPGGMATSLFDKAGSPKNSQSLMDPNKVAEVIVFMVEQDSSMVMDQVVLNRRVTK